MAANQATSRRVATFRPAAGGTLTIELVPRPSLPQEFWHDVGSVPREQLRLRFTTRYEVRYLDDYPDEWARLDEETLERLWERAART